MKEIQSLLAVLETVKTYGSENDAEAASWFVNSIDTYMTSTGKSLEKCLGLGSSRGTPSQRTQYMKAKRNDYLKKAFESIDPDKPDTVRCDQLANEIRSMEARFYINWKHSGGPPEQCSELRKNLYLAKDTGLQLPTETRYLFFLVNGY